MQNNNPLANLRFAPEQIQYQLQDPRTRQIMTSVMDSEQAFKNCLRQTIERSPNNPELHLVLVEPSGGGGRYAQLKVNDFQQAGTVFQQQQKNIYIFDVSQRLSIKKYFSTRC